MTISSTPSEVRYATDGVTTSFPIPFVFDTTADLKVLLTDEDGNVSELATGFTATGGNGSTGTLVFAAAPAANQTLTILDDPEVKQSIDYVSNDAFPAETHERGLDYGRRIDKRLRQMILRCMRVPDGDPALSDDLELPSVQNRANRLLAFDKDGKPEMAVATDVAINALTRSIIGQLLYPQTAAEAGAGVTPTNYAYPPGDVRRYGAVGEAFINGQAHVKLPVGTVTVSSQITINGISNVSLIGSGKDSVIDARSLGNTFAIRVLGSATDVTQLASAADRWATSIEVDDASGLAAGDLIEIESTEVVQEPTEHVKHEFQIVDSVNGTTVNLRGGLWFDYSVTGETVTIRKVTPVENVTFENFTILMNGSANEQQAIEVVYGKNVTFRNVRVIDAYRDGLKATKCYNVWFDSNYVEGTRTPVTGYGLYSSYSDNVTFINNKGFRNRHTIEIAAGNNTLVIGNQCKWDLSQGINTHGGANFTTVIGNTVSHCGGGIRMRGANSTIVDNEILGFNRNQGISIGEEGTNRRGLAGTNLIVQRNRIIAQEGSSMTSLDGIYSVNEIVNSSICDNDIWAGRNGILINGYRVANSDFSRNRIHKTDNSGSGIRLRMGAVGTQDGSVTRDVQHTRVSDNWFGDVVGDAIEVGSTFSDGEQEGIVIANNHFANVGGRGIELYGSFNGPVIRGNTGQAATRNLGLSNATFDTRNPLIADNVNLSPTVAQIGVTADTDGSGNASITFLRPLPLKPFIFTAIEDSTYSLIVRYSLSTDGDGKFTGATFTVTDHAGVTKPSVRVRYRIEYYNTLSDT